MNATRGLGLVFLIAGVVLQPIGWAYVHWLTPASFVLILTGVLLLFLASRELRDESSKGGDGGRALPGDVHGYSGQLHGGRSTSWESHHSSGGAEGTD